MNVNSNELALSVTEPECLQGVIREKAHIAGYHNSLQQSPHAPRVAYRLTLGYAVWFKFFGSGVRGEVGSPQNVASSISPNPIQRQMRFEMA
jgi:hypothetical protein